MKELREMSLAEIKALEEAIKARKAEIKSTAKVEREATNASIVDNVNEMISNHTLDVGMNIVVNYMGKEIVGKVVGVLSMEKKSITVESVDFQTTKAGEENTLKRRYIEKSKFVRVAD